MANGYRMAALRGSSWTLGQILVERGAQALVFFFVAKQLGAKGFGMAAVAIAPAVILGAGVQAFAQIVTRFEGRSMAARAEANLVCGALGMVCAAVICGIGQVSRLVMHSTDVGAMTTATAFVPILYAIGCVPEGILYAELQFRVLAMRRAIAVIVGGAACVALVLIGFGPWAMVAQLVVNSATTSAISLFGSGWKPSFHWNRRISTSFLKEAGANGCSAILTQLSTRAVDMLLGFFGGAAAAGIYRIARTMIDLLATLFSNPLANVLLPIFAKIGSDRERLSKAFVDAVGALVAVAGVALVGLLGLARPFAQFTFSESSAALTLAIVSMAPTLIFLGASGAAQSALLASGRARQIMVLSMFNVIITCGVTTAAARWASSYVLEWISLQWVISAMILVSYAARSLDIASSRLRPAMAVAAGAAAIGYAIYFWEPVLPFGGGVARVVALLRCGGLVALGIVGHIAVIVLCNVSDIRQTLRGKIEAIVGRHRSVH